MKYRDMLHTIRCILETIFLWSSLLLVIIIIIFEIKEKWITKNIYPTYKIMLYTYLFFFVLDAAVEATEKTRAWLKRND